MSITPIRFVVVGHIARERQARDLSDLLDASLVLDDGSYGIRDNHARAWLSVDSTDGWTVVLQDDAVPCENFRYHVHNCLSSLPKTRKPVGAVSFYVGGGKPYPWMVEQAVKAADRHESSWLIDDWLRWGVAVAMPSDLIPKAMSRMAHETRPYDQALGAVVKSLGRSILYTVPSLVDHADVPSLLGNDTVPRKAIRFGQPTSWQGSPVRMDLTSRGGNR